MEEFDPLKINVYTLDQLVDFIKNGTVTLQDLYNGGLAAPKRKPLEEKLDEFDRPQREDDEYWQLAVQKHTVKGYNAYLSRYDKNPPAYRGKHVVEALAARDELISETQGLREELFAAMRKEPWIFKADGMQKLLSGVDDDEMAALRGYDDITSRFLASGQRITMDDLIRERIIPRHITREAITGEDHYLRQTNISELGDFPEEKRTDVYFFGVPRGGKSSVLAGVLSSMSRRGVAIYQPHWNYEKKDLVRKYHDSLIESTACGKFPISTERDSISFMKLNLKLNKRENQLTFVEVGGEAFRSAAESETMGREAWAKLGAGTCLEAKNRKLLFFILDYSLAKRINDQSTEQKQAQILDTALDILSTDGTGKKFEDGCTLSKVDTVAVIVTKSDLMDCAPNERNDFAGEYVYHNFAQFMTKLKDKCGRFGINKAVNFEPYIMAFSLGNLLVGNTYAYAPRDSERIVDFISDVTSSKSTSFFGRLFGR